MKKTILVIGGSGQISSEVISVLKAAGYPVRTTSSQASRAGIKDGVETVHVDVTTGQGLKEAFAGAARVFLMAPGGHANQFEILAPLIREAKAQNLEKVVLMTAMGVDAVETSPYRRAEIELEKSGLDYVIVRPNWFLQNFHTFWIHGIKTQSKILLPAGDAKTSFVDSRDVGEVIAKVLIDDSIKNQALDLSGPESIDHHEVAAAISKESGKKVIYEEITPETLKQGLVGAGLSRDYAEFLLAILGALKAGYNARLTPTLRELLKREPRSVRDYVRDYRSSFV